MKIKPLIAAFLLIILPSLSFAAKKREIIIGFGGGYSLALQATLYEEKYDFPKLIYFKEKGEIEAIKFVQRTVEEAMIKAIEFINNSEVGENKRLFYQEDGKRKLLTAGKIRSIFNKHFIEHNCIAEEETIIACGPKSSDPHYSGRTEDVLMADQPIVIDVFPRNVRKRYVSDMTRTIVKGRATKQVKKMFQTVNDAKNAVIDGIRAGVPASDMQNLCCDIIEKNGYQTTRGGKQISRGYLHSVGHGVGLKVHEGPSLSEFAQSLLNEHNVVTVEPGLYDPDIGGVRIEDVVEVTKKGCNNLTKMEVFLEV